MFLVGVKIITGYRSLGGVWVVGFYFYVIHMLSGLLSFVSVTLLSSLGDEIYLLSFSPLGYKRLWILAVILNIVGTAAR